MRLGRKETLLEFTERAIDASFKGQLIPPLVYVPQRLRKGVARVAFDGTVTINPATPEENDVRIGQADPIGFLIAIMQGQPIPRVVIERKGKGQLARVEFEEPGIDARLRCAEVLARIRVKVKPGDAAYDAMMARAAEAGDDNA